MLLTIHRLALLVLLVVRMQRMNAINQEVSPRLSESFLGSTGSHHSRPRRVLLFMNYSIASLLEHFLFRFVYLLALVLCFCFPL